VNEPNVTKISLNQKGYFSHRGHRVLKMDYLPDALFSMGPWLLANSTGIRFPDRFTPFKRPSTATPGQEDIKNGYVKIETGRKMIETRVKGIF
jgi:hypothetical protein